MLKRITLECEYFGMDIIHPFVVEKYNEEIQKTHPQLLKLPVYQNKNDKKTLGVKTKNKKKQNKNNKKKKF